MYKILKNEKEVGTEKYRINAIERMVKLAQNEAMSLPNNAKAEQSGIDEVSVWIGVNRISTYKVS